MNVKSPGWRRGLTGQWALWVLLVLASGWPRVAVFGQSAPATSPAAAATLEAALNALRSERYADAREMLERVVAAEPANLDALSTLGFVLEQMARRPGGDGAAGQVDQALMARAVATYLAAAAAANEAEQLRLAEQMYERALSCDPASPEGLLGIARLYGRTDRALKAIERYNDYLKNPVARQPEALLELGEAYLAAGHFRQAAQSLRRAGQLDPRNARVDLSLAQAYVMMNRLTGPDSAATAIQAAMSKAPDDPEVYFLQARLLMASNQPEEALVQVRRAVELATNRLKAGSLDTAVLTALSRQYEVYTQILNERLRAAPDNLQLRLELAQATLRQADIGSLLGQLRALQRLRAAPPEQADNLKLLEMIADLEDRTRDPAAAETCRRILRLDPDNAVARRVLGSSSATAAAP